MLDHTEVNPIELNFFFSSRRRHTRYIGDWSSDVCSSDLIFLLAVELKPVLWQVSAFTLAHTITLALTVYGVVSLSPKIVEPLIAISIVYVAVENVFTSKLHAWRPLVVFCFGLLHGMGFAGVLTEIGLPRFEFGPTLLS